MTEFNPNCGKCGMLNSRGFCSLTACRYPSNVIAVQPVNVPFVPKPTTNADRIRSMTDEELAEEIVKCRNADIFQRDVLGSWMYSTDEWLDWLKKEVDNG